MKKQKILFYSQDINLGGSELLLKDIVNHLLNKNYECHVWSPFTGDLAPAFIEMGSYLHIEDFQVDKINRNTEININKKAERNIQKLLDNCRKYNKTLAIRCAGTLTTLILNKFDFKGVNLLGIFDNDSFLEGQSINGYRVHKSSDICNFSPDVVIIAHVNPKAFKEELRKYKFKKVVAPMQVTPLQAFIKTFNYFLNMYKPILFIYKINPDKVFVNNARNFWAVIVAKLLFKKVIWAIHENFNPNTFRVFPSFLYLFALKIADICIFDSVSTYSLYKDFINDSKSSIIYNGIDLEKIEKFKQENSPEDIKKELCIDPNHKIISVIGTVYPIKGQLFFVEAAINLLNSLVDKNITFLIVGKQTDGKYIQDIISLIDSSGYQNNFKLISMAPNIYSYFYITDLCVNSSITESFGIVVIEAMAFNKPIIAPCVGGIPEIIDNEIDGILIPSTNMAYNIEQKLKYLLNNEEFALNMANNAHKKVAKKFTIENTLENYERAFVEL